MKRQSVLVVVDQPNIRDALITCKMPNAICNLRAPKGGHRQNAIDLVNRAIDEVNRGIAAAK